MWNLLTVFAIYTVVSFFGMLALWTIAVKKNRVPAPTWFFWVKRASAETAPPCNEAGSWIGLSVATAALTAVILCGPPPADGARVSRRAASNQLASLNAFANDVR